MSLPGSCCGTGSLPGTYTSRARRSRRRAGRRRCARSVVGARPVRWSPAGSTSHGRRRSSGDGLPPPRSTPPGPVYVAGQDCRFRSSCPANDIVYSTSANGTNLVGGDPGPDRRTTSGVDHFIPGFGRRPRHLGEHRQARRLLLLLSERELLRVYLPDGVGFISRPTGAFDLVRRADRRGPFGSRRSPHDAGRMVRRLHLQLRGRRQVRRDLRGGQRRRSRPGVLRGLQIAGGLALAPGRAVEHRADLRGADHSGGAPPRTAD